MELPVGEPTQPLASQPPVLAQKPRRNYVLLIVLILIPVYILAAYFLINKYFYPKATKTAKTPTPTTIPTKESKEKILFTAKDIFPLWTNMPKGWEIKPDGTVKIPKIKETFQTMMTNQPPTVKVNGDFEIQFGTTTEEITPREEKTGVFVEFFLVKKDNWIIELGFRNDKFYTTGFGSQTLPEKQRFKRLVEDNTPLPKSGKVRLRVENVNSDKPEILTLYDNNTSKQLGRIQLPMDIFPGEFRWEMYITRSEGLDTTAIISDFKILAEEGDVTLVK